MNSTSLNRGPRIICRDGSTVLQRAIDIHKIRSLGALTAATVELSNPAYKAIFKSNARRQDIFTRWVALREFPRRVFDQGRPTFRCIYSESEAQELAPTATYIWEFCNNPTLGGVSVIDEIVVVCPPFFNTRDAYPESRPQLCPDVNNNEFVRSPDGHEFSLDKSIAITTNLLFYYGVTPNATYQPANVIDLYNEILRRNNADTANDFASNLFFQQCGSIHEFHSALSSSHKNDLMMQQWCRTNAGISLMWTAHLGPTLQLLT